MSSRRHEPDFNATHTQLQRYMREARPPADVDTVRALWEDQVKRRLDELEAVTVQVDRMYRAYEALSRWGRRLILWAGPVLTGAAITWYLHRHGLPA